MRDWTDVAYTLLVDSLKGPEESLYKALERANDMFLTEAERQRKQNREAFQKLKIPLRPPGPERRVVPFK